MRNKEEPRVLIVDDNEVNRTVALRLFSIIGLEAEVADNGEMAVNLYAAKQYDLIMMDIRMPVMNGVDATKGIRSIESRGECSDSERTEAVVIGMSAESYGGMNTTEYLEAGMDDCVAKPLRLDYLKELIAKLDSGDWTRPNVAKSQKEAESNSLVNFEQAAVFLQNASPESLALYKNFTAQMLESLDKIEAEINDQDNERLFEITHELMGAAVLFGFTAFCKHLTKMDQSAQSGEISTTRVLAREVSSVFEQCCHVVEVRYQIKN